MTRGRSTCATSPYPVRHVVAILASMLCSCGDDEPTRRPASTTPESMLLRHGFSEDLQLRYHSSTVERSAYEVTIEMGSRWRVSKLRPGGAAELEVTIERYNQRTFPPREKVPPDIEMLNEGLAGSRFTLIVSADGREVEHVGQEGVPPVSEFSVEALRTTIGSHVLKLPEKAVRVGQRWTTETRPPADAGPGGVTSRSQWRVLSSRPRLGQRIVELVCLSTMDPGPLRVEGHQVHNHTEFHYSYLWNATNGILEALTSTGSTVTQTLPLRDGGGDVALGEASTGQTTFEARLRLVR